MATVAVTIAGRVYRMACGEGEEAHLEELARIVNSRINDLRGSFGEIGDQRLIVMAAVTLADERAEFISRIAALEAEVERLRRAQDEVEDQQESWSREVARALGEMSSRIERVTQGLAGK